MINKKTLFLLLLLIGGVYFFRKKATDSLIIVCLFAVYLLVGGGGSEHLTNEQDEAIQNIASMYNNGTLKVTNLQVTGMSNLSGIKNIGTFQSGSATNYAAINTDGSMNCKGFTSYNGITSSGGPVTANGGINVTGPSSFNNGDVAFIKSSIRLSNGGNVYIPDNQSLILGSNPSTAGTGFAYSSGNLLLYDTSNGHVFNQANVANQNSLGNGQWSSAYTSPGSVSQPY